MMRQVLVSAALLLAVTAGTMPAQTTNAAPAVAAPAIASSSDVIAPADIIGKASAVLVRYPAPDAMAAPDPVEVGVRRAMDAKYWDLHNFSSNTEQLLARPLSLDLIQTRITQGKDYATLPKSWNDSVTARTTELDKELGQLAAAQAQWTKTRAALNQTSPPPPPEYAQQAAAVLDRLKAVHRDTLRRKNSLLQLQVQVGENVNLVRDALDRLGEAQDRARSQLIVVNAPPVWSSRPMPGDHADTLGWSKQLQYLLAYINAEPGKFLIHGLLLAILIGAFWWLRGYAHKLIREEPGIASATGIFETPLATALLLSLMASPLLYYPIAPRLLSALLGAIALVPTIILLRRLIEPRLFPILNALVVFFFLEEFRSVAAMPPATARAFLLAEILGAVIFLGWLLLALRQAHDTKRVSPSVQFAARAAFAALSAGWLAEVLGFTLLANLICVAVQRSATLALALYAGIRIAEALLFIMMRLRPLSDLGMVRLHGPLLLRRAGRVLVWVAVIVWVLALLKQFSLLSDVLGNMGGFFSTHDEHTNKLVFTLPGRVLAAIIVGLAVFQISRFTRFTLETDFYPRLHLSPGIPYAISMSLHYAALVVAFVGATYVLGINMTNFTILVSALGVGVGFGLQNIINNFVSGLILLFERPVKVGDSVQVGTDTGKVERIGIRASVLRSVSGSELIVPNGSLISSNVINWTLSNRERIILIPLNIVRGPDAGHLIELLVSAAAAHPKVVKEPAPRVLAQSLGANMGFELRAWIRASDDWNTVRSELILAINAVLTRENIALA